LRGLDVMVKVNMKFSAMIKNITDTDVAAVDVDGETVNDLLATLIRKYGAQFEKRVIDEKTGKLRRFVNVFVNGRDIRNLQGPDTKLNDGDEVRLIPTVAGG
jgi:MoaD family protein